MDEHLRDHTLLHGEWWEYLIIGVLILGVGDGVALILTILIAKTGIIGPLVLLALPFTAYGIGRFAVWLYHLLT